MKKTGRRIRDSPLQLNINIPENIDDFHDLSINTPNYDDLMESVKSPPMKSDQFNGNKQEDSRIISVNSSDTLYTPSDTPIFLNESIPNSHNRMPIDNVRARVQTRSETRNDNILNFGVRTQSMVAESPRGLVEFSSSTNFLRTTRK